MNIFYSETSIETLNIIIEFLTIKWSDKQITLLKKEILKFEQTLFENIISHQSLKKDSEIKFALIAKKQVKIFYEKIDNDIQILAFWPSRGNPDQLEKILSRIK
ncbi:hypothetical protein [Chryseobacterium terrae]|uniref:Plasmid stabilization system protein ParE n=1 Tax=Chryseobacterium terrae TaxID=3163299 RepID=A0ABW8Y1Z3_9FLAO